MQKMLEGANIKLSSFTSDINGKSSRRILNALLEGKKLDEEQLQELLHGSMHKKIPEIMKAVDGILTPLQKQLIKNIIDHIDDMSKRIEDMDKLISNYLDKYQKAIKQLDEVPGIGIQSAETILAEIGLEMKRFPTDAHISSWAGLAPGNNESAGKRRNSKTTKGNKILKTTLIQCAKSAVKKEGTFFYAQYQRLVVRRGKNRAIVAVAHSMLIAIYHMLKENKPYKELGEDYYNQFNKERKINAYLKKLYALGWKPEIATQQT
ncbi:transposase [Thermoanaerobacterium butyriciformans]|uniref:Transposase n=1 Tax=Thermoanaerobacterium butyriciformans TaxID=1702242 RepID=A0ABS4NCS6_9THEO|nr:transposase [Thermoanaerobacterium butyriciformans]